MKTTLWLTVAAFGLAIFNVSAATLYVSLESPSPSPPYTTWATAATNIQQAVDVAEAGDTVLVTNGVYAVGSRVMVDEWNQSRVVVTNAIRLESVNGPLVTIINGGGSVRCVYLGPNSVLSGFTLTKGHVGGWGRGGGVLCEPSGVMTNCVMIGNTSCFGGGVSGGTLYNCVLRENAAIKNGLAASTGVGGGAHGSILYNCTLTSNSGCGGGAAHSTLYNCTVTSNYGGLCVGGAAGSILYNCTVTGNEGGGVGTAPVGIISTVFNSIVYYNFGGNYDWPTVLNFSCTSPLPTNGVGNITGPPLFMDFIAGDYRLWEGSPCIDAGTNLIGFSATATNLYGDPYVIAYTHDSTDILGNTRFIDGNFDGAVAWDMGAYEFNSFRPPQFTCAPQRMTDCWRLSITGAPNKWVTVQKSSDLRNWEDCWSGWMGASGVKQVDDTDMSQRAMFYRVVVE